MLTFTLKMTRESDEETVTIEDFPESMEEAREHWSDAEIWSHAVANMTVKIQGRKRHEWKRQQDGKEVEPVTDWIAYCKPQVRLSDDEKRAKMVEAMSDEEKKALLKMVQEQLKG